MATERTPEELVSQALDEAYVEHVLAQAVENYASWKYAETADLDPDTCERWINNLWNELRDNLDGEQRLHAIILLIEPAATRRFHELTGGVA
jgi:hypothetical protein